MKTIKIFVSAIFILSICSCQDLLDEPIYDFRTAETAFATEEASAATLSGLYESLRSYNYYRQDFQRVVEVASVGMSVPKTWNDNDLDEQKQTPDSDLCWRIYSGIYASIAKANLIISLLPEKLETDVQKNSMGQCLFVRALNYFNLARLFGAVPIVTEKNKDNLAIPKAKNVEQVYDFIVEDLKNAFNLLAEEQPIIKEAPRKMAAKALLAAVYLQRASMTNDIEYWKLARDNATDVINSNIYSLVDDYAYLFDMNHEFSSESIFEIGFSNAAAGLGSSFPSIYLSAPYKEYTIKTQSMFDICREITDDLLNTYGGGQGNFELLKKGIDYRMSINTNVGIVVGKDAKGKPQYSYPYIKKDLTKSDAYYQDIIVHKYKDSGYAAGSNVYVHGNNWFVLRLAEMYLIAAEAENVINNGPNDAAIGWLNEILWRGSCQGKYEIPAKVSLKDFEKSGSAKQAFFERIMIERSNEFTGEGKLYFDERRFGEDYLRTLMEKHNIRIRQRASDAEQNIDLIRTALNGFEFDVNSSSNGVSFARKNLLLPIPNQAIMTNNALKLSDQNPGY